jgi:hypothetical protein
MYKLHIRHKQEFFQYKIKKFNKYENVKIHTPLTPCPNQAPQHKGFCVYFKE